MESQSLSHILSSSNILLALTVLGLLYIVVLYVFGPKYDKREPPAIPHWLPYVGHILALFRHGAKYFEELCFTTRLPIFTLQMAHKRVYIINTPSLILAAERAGKTISFAPFIVAMSPRLFDVGPREMDYITRNADLAQGNWGLTYEISQGMHSVMAPGRMLDRMVKATLVGVLGSFDRLAGSASGGGEGGGKAVSAAGKGKGLELFGWIRREFAVASTDAIYGPGNPIAREPELEQCFWDVDEGFTTLLFGPFPSITARKAFRARERITRALMDYLDRGDVKDALGVFKVRHDVARKYGATTQDMAKFEIGDLIGVLINATPTLFWALLHIYTNLELLAALRKEVEDMMTTTKMENGVRRHTIDTTQLPDACPLLISVFREVLRFHTHASTSRWVMEDTLLADKYLLKKGSIIQMPGAPIHYDPKLWGDDVDGFNPRRFLKREKGEGKAPPAGAFRAWGGGTTLCPGRFFATAEITCTLAMLVARFDIEPLENSGEWVWPEVAWSRIASSIHPPSSEIRVDIQTRKEYVGDAWAFAYADGL